MAAAVTNDAPTPRLSQEDLDVESKAEDKVDTTAVPVDEERPKSAGDGSFSNGGDPEKAEPAAAAPSHFNPASFPEGGKQAWLAVIGGAATMLATFGYLNAFGVYQEYYQTHQLADHTPDDISWIGSVQIFFQFAGGFVGGPLFDKYGLVAFTPAALAYTLSIMMTSLCHTYWQFFLAQALLGGLSIGLIFSPALAIVSHYFFRKRGMALGLVVAGSSIGGVIFPIMLNRLLYHHRLSFGWSVRICGFLVLACLLFAASVMKPRLPPSRKSADWAALRRPVYLLTLLAVWFLIWGMFVPFFYLPSFAAARGMSSTLALYSAAILNGTSFFGRLGAGIMGDRIGVYNILIGCSAASAVLLFCWQRVVSNAAILVVAALLGLVVGGIVSLMSACVAKITRNPGSIGFMLGVSTGLWGFAGLSGPPIGGAIIDASGWAAVGDYAGACLLFGSFALAAAKWAGHGSLLGVF